MQLVEAFLAGGVGMYPILVTGLMLWVAAVRYAIDTEPIRLRFLLALALVLCSILAFWTVIDVIVTFGDLALATTELQRKTALAEGISRVLNQWGLGLGDLVVGSIVVAVGVYRSGRRQLEALRP